MNEEIKNIESSNSAGDIWQQAMKEAYNPIFNNKKEAAESGQNSNERESNSKESDDYYEFEGVRYRNIDKIDISTEQGKYEWLDSLLGNDIISQEADIERLESEGFDDGDDEIVEAKTRLKAIKRQQVMLREISINNDDEMLESLRNRRIELFNRWNNMGEQATPQAIDVAMNNYYLINDMESLMESEMARRDPSYFGADEITRDLQAKAREVERKVDNTMIDGYFGEDGFIHKATQGEKLRTAATDDAEANLRYAKQEIEAFNQIFNNYNASIDYQAPRAIKKADFSPKVTEYIDNHTTEINQLLNESRSLDRNSQEYAVNIASRKKLAAERSAARRLMSKYFSAPEEPSASYHFESEMVDGEATVTVGQEIPNEWFSPRVYGEGTPLTVNRDPLITDYLMQALNIEFSKLSEDDRRRYNYAEISKRIAEEAQRTRKFPDIAAIFK